jgi:hypothetical protein
VGKARSASVSIETLVHNALLTVANADEKVRLSGKGEGITLFPTKAGANKQAIEVCLAGPPARLRVVHKEGAAEFVELTPAGFTEIAAELPDNRIAELAVKLADQLPVSERLSFLTDISRRCSAASTELLTAALTAARNESEAAAAVAAKKRQAEIEFFQQMLELKRADVNRLTREVEESKKFLQALELLTASGNLGEKPKTDTDRARNTRTPKTDADRNFQEELAKEMVFSWEEAAKLDNAEARLLLEAALRNVPGIERVGEAGETVAFDGAHHQCDQFVSDDTPVRVVRPGWVLSRDERELLLLKAHVEQPPH